MCTDEDLEGPVLNATENGLMVKQKAKVKYVVVIEQLQPIAGCATSCIM